MWVVRGDSRQTLRDIRPRSRVVLLLAQDFDKGEMQAGGKRSAVRIPREVSYLLPHFSPETSVQYDSIRCLTRRFAEFP
jgi:hypothetical protein